MTDDTDTPGTRDTFPDDEREALVVLERYLDHASGCVMLLDEGHTPPEYREKRIAEARDWLEAAADLTATIQDNRTNSHE